MQKTFIVPCSIKADQSGVNACFYFGANNGGTAYDTSCSSVRGAACYIQCGMSPKLLQKSPNNIPPFLSMYFCSLKVFLLVLKTIPMPSTVGLHVVTLMQTAVLPWLSHMLEAAAKAPVPTVFPQTVASFASRPWWTEGGQSGWTEPAACLVDQELWVRPERVTVLPRPMEAKIALEVTRTRCPVMMGPAQVQEAKILWNKLSIAM